jgi:hypothetical protein
MRRAPLAIAGFALLGILNASAVRAQDEVVHHDRATNKEVRSTGTIQEETASGIKLKSGATTKEILPSDIIEVYHLSQVPAAVKVNYRGNFRRESELFKGKEAERKKKVAEALSDYRALVDKLSNTKPAQQHVQFKLASLLAREAEYDPAQVNPAIEALTKYKTEHPNSWQIFRVANLLANLQLKNMDLEGAQKTYTDLAADQTLPKEARQEFELQTVQLLIEGGKYDLAGKQLQTLNVPESDPRAGYVKVYAALCAGASQPGNLDKAVAQIEEIIDKTKDRDLKALAYNALGDCYRLNHKPRDAMWEYLKVDMVYNQDKKQLLRALKQLPGVLDEIEKKDMANQYRERLEKEK